MKQKFTALGVCLTLLLVQYSFVFSQTNTARSSDELVALLNEPEAVGVINIKKMIAEIAPSLLNGDAALLEKLAAAMKTIENETGVDPYTLDKIVIGAKLDKANTDFLVIMQSDISSGVLAEKIYQNQLANAKLSNETNPGKEQISALKIRISSELINDSGDDSVSSIENDFDTHIAQAVAVRDALAKLPASKTNQTLITGLQKNAANLVETMNNLHSDFKSRTQSKDFSNRLETLDKQLKDISPADAQRASKIAGINKNIAQIEREYNNYQSQAMTLHSTFTAGSNSLRSSTALETAQTLLDKLPAAEPRRTQSLRGVQKSLADMQKKISGFGD